MITRTFDYRTIKRMAPWAPVISSEVIYLTDDDVGLWVFHEYKDGLKIHVEMNESCRGKEAVEKCKNAIAWAFDNTDAKIIYAEIPIENKPSCHNAMRVGMIFTHETEDRRCYEVRR